MKHFLSLGLIKMGILRELMERNFLFLVLAFIVIKMVKEMNVVSIMMIVQ